jgi:hypothetical protein
MPTDPAEQVRMYAHMVAKVQFAQSDIAAKTAKILPEIDRRMKAGEDVRKLMQARKNLRMQQLCLEDQEKRLKERLVSLVTGDSTMISVAAE